MLGHARPDNPCPHPLPPVQAQPPTQGCIRAGELQEEQDCGNRQRGAHSPGHLPDSQHAKVNTLFEDLKLNILFLRYVGPIKQGLKNKVQRELDPKNPATWDNERLSTWVKGKSKAFCKGT